MCRRLRAAAARAASPPGAWVVTDARARSSAALVRGCEGEGAGAAQQWPRPRRRRHLPRALSHALARRRARALPRSSEPHTHGKGATRCEVVAGAAHGQRAAALPSPERVHPRAPEQARDAEARTPAPHLDCLDAVLVGPRDARLGHVVLVQVGEVVVVLEVSPPARLGLGLRHGWRGEAGANGFGPEQQGPLKKAGCSWGGSRTTRLCFAD